MSCFDLIVRNGEVYILRETVVLAVLVVVLHLAYLRFKACANYLKRASKRENTKSKYYNIKKPLTSFRQFSEL